MAASLATATVRYSAANDRRIGSFARATVVFSEKDGGPAAGRSALAALIPLAFVRHLQNIGDNPYVEREQIALLDSIASALLGGKSDLGKFEARNAEAGGLSAMGIPALASERLWRARTFRTYLRQNPSGDLWAQIKVPRLREPEYYGFWFIVPLIDYAVRNESYDDTVVPAMIAVREVCAFLKLMGRGLADSSELAEDDFEPMLGAQAVVNQIVTADDPAAAAKELQRELADDFADDSSQDAAPSSGPHPSSTRSSAARWRQAAPRLSIGGPPRSSPRPTSSITRSRIRQ